MLTLKFKEALMEIVKREKGEVIFTGSISLILQGALKRKPADIDCFTKTRYYGNPECTKLNHQSSNKFWDSEGKLIEVVKGITDNGVPVDYMYREDMPATVLYILHLNGKKIELKLATVESIHSIKRDYIKRGGTVEKHSDDLPF